MPLFTSKIQHKTFEKGDYTKGNLSFVIEQHTAGNKTFYVMMLSDLLRTAQLAGLKK